MSDPIGGVANTALSGLLAAQNQADQAATDIANFGTTDSPFLPGGGGTALTGTQPTGIAGAVQQATGGTDLATQLVDLINARNAFAANVDTLNAASTIAKQAINIVT
jgi:flagellar basal body rod protein FlgC